MQTLSIDRPQDDAGASGICASEVPAKKAGIIVITGYLGAGKTTLFNRILTSEHGRRVAVIVNEIGAVGIDHHLLLGSTQPLVEMSNGCLCCTVRGDLVQNLFELLERRSDFDTVIIETTGLAEPAPILQAVYADERLREQFTLQGVVTVVDAKHIRGQLQETEEAAEQIAFADLVLLNKTDLVTAEELDAIEAELRGINRLATIARTRNSQTDIAGIFDLDRTIVAPELLEEAAHQHHEHEHEHDDDHDHAHHTHRHLTNIETMAIVLPGAVDGLKLGNWFRWLATDFGARIFRMKGILAVWGDPDRFIFQGVQTELEIRPGSPWAEGEERINRLVLIGRKLDEECIRQAFTDCVCRDPEPALRAGGGDPFRRSLYEVSPYRLEQIRYWLRQNFGYATEIPIVIKEVPCGKPGCPPIETAIIVVLRNEPPQLFKVQKAIDEITFDHIYDLMENPMPCC
jgi:G3E family GTPase